MTPEPGHARINAAKRSGSLTGQNLTCTPADRFGDTPRSYFCPSLIHARNRSYLPDFALFSASSLTISPTATSYPRGPSPVITAVATLEINE